MTRAEKMAAIVGLTCLFASEAYTEDCSFLRLDPLLLTDRQVYFEAVSGQPWQLLTQPPTNLPSGDVKLAYVFRESFREGHGGVIVAKSGRNRSYYEPQVSNRDKKIALYRGPGNYCSGTATFDGRVSAKSYDDYHDLGQEAMRRRRSWRFTLVIWVGGNTAAGRMRMSPTATVCARTVANFPSVLRWCLVEPIVKLLKNSA